MKYLIYLTVSLFLSHSRASWTVIKTEGTVNVKLNDILPAGAHLITGDGGKVKLKSGPTIMFVGSQSDLVINDDIKEPSVSIFNIAYGKLRAIVQKTKEPTLKVKTPVAIVGVRGTEFFVSIQGAKEVVCTLKGAVAVEIIKLQQTVEVPAGKGLRMYRDNEPKLEDNSPEIVKKWVSDTTF